MTGIIKPLDMVDWCMVALIIVLLATVSWYAYQYENMSLLSGAAIGIPIGALTMGLAMSARDHKEAAEREGQE